ncbi:MAG: hypothetical protein HZA61_14545 [Candidatus Eisenbacteria bacterium]|uniref:Tetratricopeptide repeat protein n=1 Tax=Eiseniibacteriota bacterium TaxID=2212470 RepID=A0A933SG55_UNCEI|nr:hypothetical protein [Candidatus Eisenbacteria bacterium]
MPAPLRYVFAALAVTALLRAVAPLVPGRWLWGIDLARDLPAAAFWPAWLALAAALAWPALSATVIARLPAPRWPHALVLSLLLAALTWAFPERAFVTGDTTLRHGAFAQLEHPEQFTPQAMPADLALHHALPRAAAARYGITYDTAGRIWGLGLAIAWTFVAWMLARTVARTPAGTWAAFGAAAFGAQLALFNGYAKATVDMNLCVLVLAAALLALARHGRRLGVAGLAIAAALVLHRSAVALLPAWFAALALGATAPRESRPRPLEWLLAAAPLAALAAVGPRMWRTFTTFDSAKHAPHGLSAFAPVELNDSLQTLLLLAPLALLAGLWFLRAGWWRRRESLALAALVLPQVALLLFVRPQQGLYRDWDVYVSVGIAVSALVAWLVAEALDETPSAAWLALPVLLAAAVPSVQWLAHQSDRARALARASDVLIGPPTRPADVRAAGYDHLGMMWMASGDRAEADRAYARSIEAAPNPRLFVQRGMNASLAGDYAAAREHYARAVELNPELTLAWRGLATCASALGDVPTMEHALVGLRRLLPNDPFTRDAEAWLQANRPAAR